ncbi:MAG: formate dehydrogenase accessory sulfurtransferase FdhD, partial [Lachnospiraceae bacterium]|nr:formate dehydrogenase accessory sulfurtransferase FdhD [Lachnospiraceae bacterium]
VRKTVRAGVPVLMSKELPTKEAVRLAGRYGLTLLSQVTLGGFLTFSEGASGRLSG